MTNFMRTKFPRHGTEKDFYLYAQDLARGIHVEIEVAIKNIMASEGCFDVPINVKITMLEEFKKLLKEVNETISVTGAHVEMCSADQTPLREGRFNV